MFVAVCEMWQKSEISDNENIISTLPLNKEKTQIKSNGMRIMESQGHNGSDNAILANDVIKSEMTVNKE
jgi:hypothetical protein